MSRVKLAFNIATYVFAGIGLLFVLVFVAMRLDLLNVKGSIDSRNEFFVGTTTVAYPKQPCIETEKTQCAWNQTPEWVVVRGGLEKDASIIARVASETGVPARLIAAAVVPEQIRFFTSEREVFKRYFEPLKILGSLSQFSLGVSGIKQETAEAVERYASDPSSPFYVEGHAELIAYTSTTTDKSAELFNRLTDDKDHYYSYLYTALNIKQYLIQWERAGFPISDKPDIVVTLFNLGHAKSFPKASPESGGASVSVGGYSYLFGTLGGLFYSSNELIDIFPRQE